MNVKRGLLRTWLVLSAAYVIGAGYISWPSIQKGFDLEQNYETYDVSGYEVPVICSRAKGQEGPDFWRETVITPDVGTYLCWYSIPAYRKNYPEFSSLSDVGMIRRAYDVLNIPMLTVYPWKNVWRALWVAIGGPVAALFVGSVLFWAAAGFAGPSQRRSSLE